MIVYRTLRVIIGGTTYKPGDITIADSSGLLPIFGETEWILFIHNEWHFVCQLINTNTWYNTYYHAYEV